MFKRSILSRIKNSASYLILGPRQTGKSTLLSNISVSYKLDLLIQDKFFQFNKDPDLLYKEITSLQDKSSTVWIDEIQKIPALLDVVHKLMFEFPNLKFILSGSSARKLKRGAANLLGGRAIDLKMHPLTIEEMGKDFDLELALRYGTMPKIYSTIAVQKDKIIAEDLLGAYISTYLEQEIIDESLTRNLASFQRFLEIASFQSGLEINFSLIADDVLVEAELVKDYYSILEDTLIGFFLYPYQKSPRKRLTKRPKFYFFDNGVARAGARQHTSDPTNQERGKLFEQFMIQELRRLNDYKNKGCNFYFWCTSNRAEVDLIIEKGQEIIMAIEFKAGRSVGARDFRGLNSFYKDFPKVPRILCAPVEKSQRHKFDNGMTAIDVVSPAELVERFAGI